MAFKAEIVEIVGNYGPKGLKLVKCRVLEGIDKGKIIERFVVGTTKVGDLIWIKDTSIETVSTGKRR